MRDEHPVGARVEGRADRLGAQLGHADDDIEPDPVGGGDEPRQVGRVEDPVLAVEDDEVVAAVADDLHDLQPRDRHEGGDATRTGLGQRGP